jgi:MYXO-CTERM domain-containing protein
MGLAVPAGSHEVVLDYDDPSVRVGAAISAAAALVSLGLLVAGRRRRERS